MGKEDLSTKKSKSKERIRKKIAEDMSSFAPSKKRIHIISYGDRWGILREGAKRLSKICSDKTTAVVYAKRIAQKETGSSVIIHKRDGSPERYIHA